VISPGGAVVRRPITGERDTDREREEEEEEEPEIPERTTEEELNDMLAEDRSAEVKGPAKGEWEEKADASEVADLMSSFADEAVAPKKKAPANTEVDTSGFDASKAS